MIKPKSAMLVAIGTTAFCLYQPLSSLLPPSIGGTSDGAVLAQKRTLPSSSRRPSRVPGSVPSGPRGGQCPANLPLQTLLFQNRIGQTVSAQPVFLWHISKDSPIDVKFVLSDPTQEEPIYTNTFDQPKAGFMALKLPSDIQLAPGRQYLWSVMMVCSAKDDTKNPTARGTIEVITASSELTRQLTSATSPSQQAEIYAQQGLWYDALNTLWSAYSAKPTATTRNAFLSLLNQMGHEEVVQQEQAHQLTSRSSQSR